MPKVKYTTSKGLYEEAGKGFFLNYTDFLTGNASNLTETAVAITQSEGNDADVGGSPTSGEILLATLTAGGIHTFAGDGSGVTSIYLPAASADTHVAVRITGDVDQTGAVTIAARGSAKEVQRGSNAVFAKQVIGPLYNNVPDSIATDGTDAAPTAIKLVYTAAAADTNFLGIGSVIHFYCQTEGQWLVRVFNVPEGTGATGAFTTSTS